MNQLRDSGAPKRYTALTVKRSNESEDLACLLPKSESLKWDVEDVKADVGWVSVWSFLNVSLERRPWLESHLEHCLYYIRVSTSATRHRWCSKVSYCKEVTQLKKSERHAEWLTWSYSPMRFSRKCFTWQLIQENLWQASQQQSTLKEYTYSNGEQWSRSMSESNRCDWG